MKRKQEKRKGKLIKIATGILHISHKLSSTTCRLYVYINYFIFLICSHRDNWFNFNY